MNSVIQHYIFIKGDAYSKSGALISAFESTCLLLKSGLWPLYSSTSNRKRVKAGDLLLFYISGKDENCQKIIASAKISKVEPWKPNHTKACPIHPELAHSAVVLSEVLFFENKVDIKTNIDNLSFLPSNKKKWGTAFMGGVRKIPTEDYNEIIKQS